MEPRRLAGAACFLVGLTLAAYSPLAANHSFVFDDDGYVVENLRVRDGLTAQGLLWAFGSFETANWHPVTWISHMLDVQLFGLDARSHHAVNLLLHVLNSVLLLLGLRALTGQLWPSCFVAALFAVHPLHVESVAWISERKDLLCTLFGLLAAGAWLSWVRRRRPGSYALMLAGFALSLLSKPMLVTLPFVLLLCDWWPLGRLGPASDAAGAATRRRGGRLGECLTEKLPLLLLSAAASLVAVAAQSRGASLQSLEQFAVPARLANALVGYATYLRKFLWPDDLAAFYPYVVREVLSAETIGAALLLAAVTAAATALAGKAPFLLAGWLFFLGTLVPVIGLVQVGEQSLADRYTYVPLVGVMVALAWGLPRLAVVSAARTPGVAAAAAVVLALAVATAEQTHTWRNAGALWTRALDVTRANWFAHNNLGVWLFGRGDTIGAIAEFSRALSIKPGYAEALYNLAFAQAKAGRLEEAERQARAALVVAPRWVPPRTLLGTTLLRSGRRTEALAEYLVALQLEPGRAGTHRLLADALHLLGRTTESEFHFREALRLNPGVAETHNELGVLLAANGRLVEAMEEFRGALALRRDYPHAHYNLGKALDELGEVARAIPHYREALRLDPSFADAHNNLAVDLLQTGDRAGAVQHLRAALRLRPDFPAARDNLERAAADVGDRD